MMVLFALLLVAYQLLMVEVIRLNQVGPGWEVPPDTMWEIGSLTLISVILLCAILIAAWVLRKKIFTGGRLSGALLLGQLGLCIAGTIFLYGTDAYHGQFYHPDVLVPAVFYGAYASVLVLPAIRLICFLTKEKNSPI